MELCLLCNIVFCVLLLVYCEVHLHLDLEQYRTLMKPMRHQKRHMQIKNMNIIQFNCIRSENPKQCVSRFVTRLHGSLNPDRNLG